MNQQRKTCALLAFSLATISTAVLFSCGISAAQPAHRHHHQAKSAPVLAGNAAVNAPRARFVSAISRVETIPLMPAFEGVTHAAAKAVYANSSGKSIDRTLHVGESEIFEFNKISTTAVGDPTVADISPLSINRLLVSARGTGHTTIFVYDAAGKNTISVTVLPSENMDVLANRIEEEIGIPTVTVRAINDTIFLEGAAPNAAAVALAEAIATAYSPKVKNLIISGDQVNVQSEAERYSDLLNGSLSSAGISAKPFDEKTIILTGKYAMPIGALVEPVSDNTADDTPQVRQQPADPLKTLLDSLPTDLKVINLINFERQATRQVLVRTKIVDIDRQSTKTLGVNWGQANYTLQQIGTTGSTQRVLDYLPQPILFSQAPGSGFSNLLGGGGPLSRFLPYAAQLNALIADNKARVLSEPSLLVLDGNQASMLVGGEFPVPVLQSGNGGGVTVTFKPFGVRLTVAPTIVSDDTVQLTVTPEVSSIDFANAVQFNGSTIPGVNIRRTTSTLQMKDGQTLVIGGLYSNNDSKNINKIPLLGNLPIIGEFFKSTSTVKEERELLVLLEVEIVTPDSLTATPPQANTSENLSIQKPYIPRKEFDQDFPDLQNGPPHHDPEQPKTPVALPPTGK